MSKPMTEAGKRLADDGMYHAVECWMSGITDPCDCGLVDRILAVEAEARAMTGVEAVNLRVAAIEARARAAVLRELREEVEGLPMGPGKLVSDGESITYTGDVWAYRDAVLDIIERLEDPR